MRDKAGGFEELSSAKHFSIFSEYSPVHRQIHLTVRVFRYISLLLTSLFFLAGPLPLELEFKLLLIVILAAAAAVKIFLYSRYQKNAGAIKIIALLEMLGIGVLVLLTGLFESPFIWYALNPLIIASVYLPFIYTWIYFAVFLSMPVLAHSFFIRSGEPLLLSLLLHLDIVLILSLLVLMVYFFTRIYIILSEQSQQLHLQQDELFSSFIDLFESHQVMQSLSNFQREIVSFKKEEDIFNRLLDVSVLVFPVDNPAVLLFDEPREPQFLTPGESFRVIGKEGNQAPGRAVMDELRDRWQEFCSTTELFTSGGHRWVAMPVKTDRNKIMAVFVARVKPGTKIQHRFPADLSLFINFTEQVIQNLASFRKTEQTLYHLSSLYEAVEAISSRDDPKEILDLFGAYARNLTGCRKTIFWLEQVESPSRGWEQGTIFSVKGEDGSFPEELWHAGLLQAWSEIRENLQPVVRPIEDNGEVKGQMVCVPVKSRSRCFGLLAALQSREPFHTDEIIQKLSFLSELSAVTIERNMAEVFASKLMLIEEQKRIANEIHDSISQNLFSIVYGLESVVKNAGALKPELQERLGTVRDIAAKTAKELRVLIFRLSPRQRHEETFLTELNEYLNGLSSINNISIDFDVSGTEDFLNPAIQNAFYRIIKEATGNAIRHGQCSSISVGMEMNPFHSTLKVADNGRGFNTAKQNSHDKVHGGLGIINMRELALSLQGSFSIESEPGKGTTVTCSVPTSPVSRGRAVTT